MWCRRCGDACAVAGRRACRGAVMSDGWFGFHREHSADEVSRSYVGTFVGFYVLVVIVGALVEFL